MTEEQLKKEYEDKLAALRAEQSNCDHEWGVVKYDPKIKKEPYGYCQVVQGSDVWGEPAGYQDVEYKRWSRTCQKCGKVEYTSRLVPFKYVPEF
ncbi:hypothetical protein D7X98_04020 [bacterium 1XD8-76]|nr:hypothetical protein D7X98_04020 [bacterium 1XD8-76]